MAFGRGKKRESWSSRPLSMIIPENVKIFQRKGKAVMEKAMVDQSRRELAYVTSNSEGFPKPRTVASESPLADIAESNVPDVAALSIKTPTGDSTDTVKETTLSQESKGDTQPFLTLNLGDTPSSLLEFSDKYSNSDRSWADESSMVNDESNSGQLTPDNSILLTSERNIKPEIPDDVEIKDSTENIHDDANGKTSETPLKTDNTEPVATSASSPSGKGALSIDKIPWVAPETGPTKEMLDTVGADAEVGNSEDSSDISSPELASGMDLPSLNSSRRQDSFYSSDSGPNTMARHDEFVIDHNRKVMVSRGLYIFDPADDPDIMQLKLSADESFNPFEFD